jgi:hypothetical protein
LDALSEIELNREAPIEKLVLTGLDDAGTIVTECEVPQELLPTAYVAMGLMEGQEPYTFPCEIEPDLADTIMEGAEFRPSVPVSTWELVRQDLEDEHALPL